MDTRMLDVVIGLVLVVALLSLVATAAQEALAGMRNSRGQNLARLVCSLVGDNKRLSQEILEHPFIQSMAMELPDHAHQRMPSYLPSDVFVTGLLGFLSQYTGNSRPVSPAMLVEELRSKLTLDTRQQFSASLAALLPGVENDWPAFEKRLQAWFDAVGERSSGWYKRKNQVSLFFIGALFATALNVNPFVIGKALWNDAALRKSALEQAGLALQAYQTQTGAQPGAQSGAYVTAIATRASAATSAAARATDKALNTISSVLEAAAEHTKDAELTGVEQPILQPMKDAIEMRRMLGQERLAVGDDPKQLAQRDSAAARFDYFLGKLRELVPEGVASAKDCTPVAHLSCAVLKQLDPALKQLKAAIDAERGVHAPRNGSDGAAAAAFLTSKCEDIQQKEPGLLALCQQLRQLGVFMPAGMPLGWSETTWPRVFGDCPQVPRTTGDSCRSWTLASWADAGNWGIAFMGWLMTGLGVTLGAPFWFDLLSKLMKVRSSGVKPVDTGVAGATTTAATAPPSTLTPAVQAAGDATGSASDDGFSEAERLLSDDEVTRIQRNLNMPATAQTGRLDLTTRAAIAQWQTQYGVASTGQLTQAQIQQLLNNPTTFEDDGYVG